MLLKNRILAAFPQSVLDRYFSALQPTPLSPGEVLYEPGDPITHVYFIQEGIVSSLVRMSDGTTIETGMIGMEGIVGACAVLGREVAAHRHLVRVSGAALRLSADEFRAAFDRSAEVRSVVLRLIDATLRQVAQSAACNGLHTVQQRFARWLLMTHDRYSANIIPLTHDFMASMLGVRRAGVTEAAGQFQKAGAIRYTRGRVRILDRPGVEAVACECYRIDHELLMLLCNPDLGRPAAG